MEMFGILCSLPAAFLASAAYSFVIRQLVRKQPWIKRVLLRASTLVLSGLIIEWVLLATLGPVQLRGLLGPAFYPAHLVVSFLSVPALATALTVKKDGTLLGAWYIVALLCSVLALPVVLTQYGVSEALYGIDSTGGPYGAQ